MNLDDVDLAVGGPMQVRRDGVLIAVPSASELPWRIVAASVGSRMTWLRHVWPGDSMKVGHLNRAHRAWITHNGLPDPDALRRLVYMLDKYGDAIQVDLQRHYRLSADELWRQRRWSEVLRLVDHMPQDSHLNRLLTNDEEYMTAILKRKKGPSIGPSRPSMADWSLTNSMLAQLIDAVNKNTATIEGVNAPKGKPAPKVEPYPRPATVTEKVERKLQREKHEEMVGMLLPGRG